jgi:DNA repair protein RadC
MKKPKNKIDTMENLKFGEVGLYYKSDNRKPSRKIGSSLDLYDALRSVYNHLTVEHKETFYVLALNNSNFIVDYYKVSEGGITSTVVDVRNIMQFLLLKNAVGFVITHNHPSGTLKASRQDIKLTEKLKKAGETLDIKLLDHIIYTNKTYMSMADEQIL